MDRLIAYRANEPEGLRAALLAERAVLFPDVVDDMDEVGKEAKEPQSPPHGAVALRWGIGYYIGGEPHVQRFAATPAQGFAALKELRADVVIAQVGGEGTASVPPYRYGRYLLGLHGELPRQGEGQAEPSSVLPGFLQHNLRDHSEKERLLHLVCARLHEAAPEYLEDVHLAPEVAVAALSAVLRSTLVPVAGAPSAKKPLTLTMANGEWLVVAQLGGPSIFYRPLLSVDPAGSALPGEGSRLKMEGEPRAESYRGIFALGRSDVDAQTAMPRGFKHIPADHALVIGRDVTFQLLPLE